MFELNDKVIILSGGISGFPTVNLAGVQGRVVSPHPSTPDGWIAVWVDWSQTPYTNMPGLPNPINNTPEMIDYVEAQTAPAKTGRGHLQSVSAPAQESARSQETEEPEEVRPPSPFKLI